MKSATGAITITDLNDGLNYDIELSAPVIYKDSVNAATNGVYTSITATGKQILGSDKTTFGFLTSSMNGGAESTPVANTITISPTTTSKASVYRINLYRNANKTGGVLATVDVPVVFKGAVGSPGTPAKVITLSPSALVFKVPETGATTPSTITVVGSAQGTSISSWSYSTNGGTYSTTRPPGVTISGSTVTVTASTMTANSISIKASDGTVDDVVTISKVADGATGAPAKILDLSATAEVMSFNSDSTPTSPQTVSFTANLENLTGTATFAAIPYNASGTALTAITLGGTGNTRTLTSAQWPSTAVRVVVKATLSGYSDTVSVIQIKDGVKGADPIVGFLTNESVTLTASPTGVVSNFSTATGTFEVYEGLVRRTGAAPTYTRTTQVGCTAAITTSGVYSVSAMTADVATATFTATLNGVTLTKTLSLAKSREGVKGDTGAKGDDGIPSYTWIKYADDAQGNGMTDKPEGKRFMGMAFNKTTATESSNKADYQWSSLYDDKIAGELRSYVQSRGENLVTNGTGLLGNNTNFSGFTFDGSQAFAGAGSFYTAHQNSSKLSDESIPVDPSKRYRFSLMAKSEKAIGRNYFGFTSYDLDGHLISPYSYYGSQYPIRKLAKDLKVGDTEIHLVSSEGFMDSFASSDHRHSIVFWGYKNSFGYEYPAGTYSRTTFTAAWENGAINRTTHVIKLNKPFNITNKEDAEGVFRAGHEVSPTSSGGSYQYTTASNVIVPTDWTYYEGVITGNGITAFSFPYGTAFVKLMFLVNRETTGGARGDSLWVNSLNMTDITSSMSFTWIKYADSITGAGISSSSTGKDYIGLALNKPNENATDNPRDYTWSLFRGPQGVQGPQGAKGATGERGPQGPAGTSVSSITENYLATPAGTGVTTGTSGWTTTVQTMTLTNKYLWNYEKITFSDGSTSNTIPVIIGVHGATGATGGTGPSGSDGRSITGITENYLATASASGVTRSTSGWTTAVQPTTDVKKYLWNYETITWSKAPLTTYVEPIIIGVHGATGATGAPGANGKDALSVMLLNENQSLSATSSRTISPAQTIDIPFVAYLGTSRIPATASYGALPAGVTLKSNTPATASSDGLLSFNVANAANLGGTTTAFDRGKIDITIAANGTSVVRPFNWTKTVAGSNGRVYYVEPDIATIKKDKDGNYTPSAVTFTSTYKDGTGATKTARTAYWKIETTINGSTWIQHSTHTGSLVSTLTVNVPNNIVALRATTYSSTALTVATSYDTQTVMIVSDGATGSQGPQGPQGKTGARGATGEQGPRGPQGTSVDSIVENYLATTLGSGVTTGTSGWTTTVQSISASKKYLWNYEKINFSDGTSQNTVPVIIGVYGDTGPQGSTGGTGPKGEEGRSITGITEHYLASTLASGVTRLTSGWTTTMQPTDDSKRYLWNYETITWSKAPLTTYIEPIVIGVHGAKGDQGAQGPAGPNEITKNTYFADDWLVASHIQSLNGLTIGDQFKVDNQGNVTFGGTLTGASGIFSGRVVTGSFTQAGQLTLENGTLISDYEFIGNNNGSEIRLKTILESGSLQFSHAMRSLTIGVPDTFSSTTIKQEQDVLELGGNLLVTGALAVNQVLRLSESEIWMNPSNDIYIGESPLGADKKLIVERPLDAIDLSVSGGFSVGTTKFINQSATAFRLQTGKTAARYVEFNTESSVTYADINTGNTNFRFLSPVLSSDLRITSTTTGTATSGGKISATSTSLQLQGNAASSTNAYLEVKSNSSNISLSTNKTEIAFASKVSSNVETVVKGRFEFAVEPITSATESGYCGLQTESNTTANGTGIGYAVNFRTTRTTIPSTVTIARSSGNITNANVYIGYITNEGFWFQFTRANLVGTNTAWRGRYTVV